MTPIEHARVWNDVSRKCIGSAQEAENEGAMDGFKAMTMFAVFAKFIADSYEDENGHR